MNLIRQILRKTILTIVMAGCSTCSLLFAMEAVEETSLLPESEFVCYEYENSDDLEDLQSCSDPYLSFNIANNLISTISRYHFIAKVFDFNGKELITVNNAILATIDPSAKFILTGYKNGDIKIFNLGDGSCLHTLSLSVDTQVSSIPAIEEYKNCILSATFNRSGNLIAASAYNIT